jgi:hypothetical protein
MGLAMDTIDSGTKSWIDSRASGSLEEKMASFGASMMGNRTIWSLKCLRLFGAESRDLKGKVMLGEAMLGRRVTLRSVSDEGSPDNHPGSKHLAVKFKCNSDLGR